MTISIVKSESKVSALVAAIAVKSGAYKEVVSSALLSAIAHGIESGDYTLISKVVAEVQTANPRDLKVVGAFLQSVSPYNVVAEKVGRIETYKILGRIEKDYNGVNEADFKTRKDFEKAVESAKKKAGKKDASRLESFARFIGTLKNEKGEAMPRGAVVPVVDSDEKTVFDYQLNIFSWFDDVNYFRAKAAGESDAKAFDFDAMFVSKVAGLIKGCEGQELSDEQRAALESVTAFYNAASQRKADKEAQAKEAKEAAAATAKAEKQQMTADQQAAARLAKAGVRAPFSREMLDDAIAQMTAEKAEKAAKKEGETKAA